jgi:transposase-like protein
MRFSEETKQQILKEIEEVGNITLVCKKQGIKRTTVMNWLHKVKNKDKISDRKQTRELQKVIKDQEHEILVLRALLKKTYPLWNNEKPLS